MMLNALVSIQIIPQTPAGALHQLTEKYDA
jgi:hypothetical protein